MSVLNFSSTTFRPDHPTASKPFTTVRGRSMTVRMVVIVVLAAALVWPGWTAARICSHDQVPAATLLFPFVVYDYNAGFDGDVTTFHITNISEEAQIVRLTIWSDTHIPVLAFNLVLSGYDKQVFNIRDILRDGVLPVTGTSGGVVVSGSVAEHGPVDGTPDLGPPDSTATLAQRCPSSSPVYPGNFGEIPAGALDLVKTLLQYSQSVTRLHTDCDGADYNLDPLSTFESRDETSPTWMYITADVVWTCTCLLPSVDAATYWQDGPTNNPTFQPDGAQRMTSNVLMGQMFFLNAAANFSEGILPVHLEADPDLGAQSLSSPVRNPTSGQLQTFYHAYSAPTGVSDLREPLPTAWSFGFLDDDDFVNTYVRVFKAPNASPDLDFAFTVDPPVCGADPWTAPSVSGVGSTMTARDCLAYTYYAWDEDADVVAGGGLSPNMLPLATQEVRVQEFAIPGTEGWLQFLWPPTNTRGADNYQVWMGVKNVVYNSSMARPALVMANDNCTEPILFSGFETGTTVAWSNAVP